MCDVKYDKTVKTDTTTKTVAYLDDADPTIPYRLVGSYEYARAVQRFEQLLEISTADEVLVYDKLLAQQPQLTFYAGMFLERDLVSRLNLTIDSGMTEFKERFLRTGMAWMLALAKTELGATISAYGNQKIKQPFGVFGPNQIDAEPFLLLMADDLLAHIDNLSQDKKFAKASRGGGRVDTWTLAYLRRLNLLEDMIDTLTSANNQEFNARVKPISKRVERGQFALQSMIAADQKETTLRTTSTNRRKGQTRTSIIDRECDDLDHDIPLAETDRR